jgi:hypothetical protein
MDEVVCAWAAAASKSRAAPPSTQYGNVFSDRRDDAKKDRFVDIDKMCLQICGARLPGSSNKSMVYPQAMEKSRLGLRMCIAILCRLLRPPVAASRFTAAAPQPATTATQEHNFARAGDIVRRCLLIVNHVRRLKRRDCANQTSEQSPAP